MPVLRIAATFAAVGLTLSAMPASAESNIVSGTSVHAYNVANVLTRRGDGPLEAKDAKLIERAILADTRVDDGERAMLGHLIAGETFLIKHPKQDFERQFNRVASDEAKALLSKIAPFSYDDPLLQSWMEATPESVGKIVALYQGTSQEQEQALAMLTARAKSVWGPDSWEDQYSKMKSEVAAWSSRCNLLSGSAYNSCKAMAYRAMLEADKDGRDNHTGNIPDFIYNHWKPEED